ncbi:unnamed protein product [Cochlearia groenlandica]
MSSRQILATPSHERLAIIVDDLFARRNTVEYISAIDLYRFCAVNFSNCSSLMLLKIYRYDSDDVVRFRSLRLLSDLRNLVSHHHRLSLFALVDIKPLLISCLTMPESARSDTWMFRDIVSFVASNVFDDGGGWDELGDCMVTMLNTDPLRAFNVFLDLPQIYGGFMARFDKELADEVYEVLLNPENNSDDDWILALDTAMKLGIRLLDLGVGTVPSREILENVLRSADKVVSIGKEQFLEHCLEHLAKFLAREAKLCRFSIDQRGFLEEFAVKIGRIGTRTKKAVKEIYRTALGLKNYEDDDDGHDHGVREDRELYNSLNEVTALKTFADTNLDVRTRETALRRLHHLLRDNDDDDDSGFLDNTDLKPLLIRCLKEERIPENTFKILGQTISHITKEALWSDPWFDLWDYIASAEFEKSVYIFQCLTMQLTDKEEDIVIPLLNNILPEIYKRLNPPKELSVHNSSCWVLAFTGAFCSAIRLVNTASYTFYVKEIAGKMVDSAKELVERGIEVGVVRRAFRDVESIMEEQWDWYESCEYRFVKGLLWKLYAIESMKMESRMVLWRINAILERNVDKTLKVLPETREHG